MMPAPDCEYLAHIVARNNAEIDALRQRIDVLEAAQRQWRRLYESHCLNAAHSVGQWCPVCVDGMSLYKSREETNHD